MAFNWQTFRTRTATAVVFVVVMLFGLFFNRWSFFLLFSIIHFGAWLEYIRLVKAFNPDYKSTTFIHRFAVMLGGWCLLLFFTNYELAIARIPLTEIGFWSGIMIAILLPMIMFLETRMVFFKNIIYSFVGLVYISLPLALMIDLRNQWSEEYYQHSMTIPLIIIFSVWINDTMAYIVGSVIGKTPLSPISPKKTREGTAGGIILTIIAISCLAYFNGRISVAHAAVMAAIASVAGTFGDLFESKLKRMAGVKDSGQIMPGHGGFLDRFDSVLFSTVFVWLYASFFIP